MVHCCGCFGQGDKIWTSWFCSYMFIHDSSVHDLSTFVLSGTLVVNLMLVSQYKVQGLKDGDVKILKSRCFDNDRTSRDDRMVCVLVVVVDLPVGSLVSYPFGLWLRRCLCRRLLSLLPVLMLGRLLLPFLLGIRAAYSGTWKVKPLTIEFSVT